MEKKFGRTLIGYKKKDIEKKIDSINMEFEKAHQEYHKQLVDLQIENEKLKHRARTLQTQALEYRNTRDELANILFNAYMDTSTLVYDVSKKNQEMEKDKMDILSMQQKKRADIKSSINEFLSQIHNIISN